MYNNYLPFYGLRTAYLSLIIFNCCQLNSNYLHLFPTQDAEATLEKMEEAEKRNLVGNRANLPGWIVNIYKKSMFMGMTRPWGITLD